MEFSNISVKKNAAENLIELIKNTYGIENNLIIDIPYHTMA